MKTKALIVECVGWLGTVLIVLAYFLISYGYVGGESIVYQAMNLAGALSLGISLYGKKAWPALALQLVWGIIALGILINVLFLSSV